MICSSKTELIVRKCEKGYFLDKNLVRTRKVAYLHRVSKHYDIYIFATLATQDSILHRKLMKQHGI